MFEQKTELRLGMSRTQVLHDPLTPIGVLSDLDSSGPRSSPHPPNERHPETLEPPPLVRENAPTHTQNRRSAPRNPVEKPKVTKLRMSDQRRVGGAMSSESTERISTPKLGLGWKDVAFSGSSCPWSIARSRSE